MLIQAQIGFVVVYTIVIFNYFLINILFFSIFLVGNPGLVQLCAKIAVLKLTLLWSTSLKICKQLVVRLFYKMQKSIVPTL